MHQTSHPSALLIQHLTAFNQLPEGPILDLACGYGRNGLLLANIGHNVLFADRNETALATVQQQLSAYSTPSSSRCWPCDFEQGSNPLAEQTFAAAIVVNYLHRPLLPWLAEAIEPGGIILYETFLTAQAQLGKPSNPDFLLHPDELAHAFSGWQALHYYEGECASPHRFVAQLVARKPTIE
ncbi:MAG: methyltransferase domain-containing protein [Ferrimonas sp.]